MAHSAQMHRTDLGCSEQRHDSSSDSVPAKVCAEQAWLPHKHPHDVYVPSPQQLLQRQDAPGHRRHLQADTGAERQRGSRCGGGMSGQPLARGTWPAAVAVSRR